MLNSLPVLKLYIHHTRACDWVLREKTPKRLILTYNTTRRFKYNRLFSPPAPYKYIRFRALLMSFALPSIYARCATPGWNMANNANGANIEALFGLLLRYNLILNTKTSSLNLINLLWNIGILHYFGFGLTVLLPPRLMTTRSPQLGCVHWLWRVKELNRKATGSLGWIQIGPRLSKPSAMTPVYIERAGRAILWKQLE